MTKEETKLRRRTKVNYRKIYETNYGEIPRDEWGRKYEIHHIDGNSHNNELSNLLCVSIQEHYDIHLSRGDYQAAYRIGKKMKLSPTLLSELARKFQLNRVKNGTHHLLGENHHNYDHTIYKFENIHTGEIIETTREKMTKIIGTTRIADVAIGNRKLANGWRLYSSEPYIHLSRCGDLNTYKFKNDHTNEIVEDTCSNITKRFSLSDGKLSAIVRGKRKSHKGWRLYNE
jgi:hypothetical protein